MCVCVSPEVWRNYGAEQYGPDSVCVYQRSAFVMEQCSRKQSYPDWGSGCYKVRLVLVLVLGGGGALPLPLPLPLTGACLAGVVFG